VPTLAYGADHSFFSSFTHTNDIHYLVPIFLTIITIAIIYIYTFTRKSKSKPYRHNQPLPKSPRIKKRRRNNSQKELVEPKLPINYSECPLVDIWVHHKPKLFKTLPPEQETGNTEYKFKLCPPTQDRLEQLVSQMQFRLAEGLGEAKYEIGVSDDGSPIGITEEQMQQSLQTLNFMADQLSATNTIVRVRNGTTEGKIVAEVSVRKLSEGKSFTEVRVAACGNVDAGKSTLLGVLTRGCLDNGRGKARLDIFKHKHEIESGRTSDITREILGFDSSGNVVNDSSIQSLSWSEICELSRKVIVFLDLAGDNRYFKSTVRGLIGNFPDFVMIIVAGNMGVTAMTREYYQLCLALKIRCFFVLTKVDICDEATLQKTITELSEILTYEGIKKHPIQVQTMKETLEIAEKMQSDETHEYVPLFCVSNVTGENLDLVRSFLNHIVSVNDWETLQTKPPLFYVNNTYSLPDAGTIVSGTLAQGQIRLNQTLLLGPDSQGNFSPVQVTGIHTNRLPVKIANAGLSISVALKDCSRATTRKGQVLVDVGEPKAVWEFVADMIVTDDSTTLWNSGTENNEVVVHCGCSRQTAKIVQATNILRSSFGSQVRFRYKFHPEFVIPGQRIIFRNGKSRGIGTISRTCELS